IEGNAFKDDVLLYGVYIPASVTSIMDSSFTDCSILSIYGETGSTAEEWANNHNIPFIIGRIADKEINVLENSKWKYIDDGNSITIIEYLSSDENVVIPEMIDGKPVIGLKVGLFKYHNSYDNNSIKTVEIQAKIKTLPDEIFASCYDLTSIVLPDTLEEIGSNAMNYCSSLTKIEIPDSVRTIGTYAFYSCGKLTDLKLPESLEEIGSSAFSYCKSITDIEFNDRLKIIWGGAFSYCEALEKVELPESLKDVKSEYGYISERALNGSTFLGCKNLKEAIIPEGIIQITSSTFSNCEKLEKVTLPSTVEIIGGYSFQGCTSLKTIELPEGTKTIEGNAFKDDVLLYGVYIPA
ncbi:MAG: leucine-rich repeat domain-containing protein, partial [Erysipelotrichaceae bacterium]|nr:leucine-rich repeat domain-containing protein [Erysipelotrichaceae bacterium]